jgi:endoglucanase
MFIDKALAAIDTSFAETDAPAKRKAGLGRRAFFFGGTALAAAYAGLPGPGATRLNLTASASEAPLAADIQPTLPALPHVFAPRSAADIRNWEQFRARFILPDGRVVDSGNNGISHTEGQGLGMLFAVAFDDRATFDRIWDWTQANLSRGDDALHAWRYVPGAANPVSDTNNATDGDIYIAGALSRASVRWGSTPYLAAAGAITRDLLALAVRNVGGRTVLLPAVYGFDQRGWVDVNLSYYVFPLLADLATAFPSPLLTKVIDDGRRLVAEASFGRRRLPPDWLRVSARDGSLSLSPQHPARFSFDAVRIPLFLAWAGGTPAELRPYADFWGDRPERAAAWVDLETDLCAPYRASNGVVSIAKLVGSGRTGQPPVLPAISGTDDYYSAALNMIVRLAAQESSPLMAGPSVTALTTDKRRS